MFVEMKKEKLRFGSFTNVYTSILALGIQIPIYFEFSNNPDSDKIIGIHLMIFIFVGMITSYLASRIYARHGNDLEKQVEDRIWILKGNRVWFKAMRYIQSYYNEKIAIDERLLIEDLLQKSYTKTTAAYMNRVLSTSINKNRIPPSAILGIALQTVIMSIFGAIQSTLIYGVYESIALIFTYIFGVIYGISVGKKISMQTKFLPLKSILLIMDNFMLKNNITDTAEIDSLRIDNELLHYVEDKEI